MAELVGSMDEELKADEQLVAVEELAIEQLKPRREDCQESFKASGIT